jgi:hypothetical protein
MGIGIEELSLAGLLIAVRGATRLSVLYLLWMPLDISTNIFPSLCPPYVPISCIRIIFLSSNLHRCLL